MLRLRWACPSMPTVVVRGFDARACSLMTGPLRTMSKNTVVIWFFRHVCESDMRHA